MLNPFLHRFLRCIKTFLVYLKENIRTYGSYTFLHVNSKNNRRDVFNETIQNFQQHFQLPKQQPVALSELLL